MFTSPTIVYYLFGVALLLVNGLLNITFWVIADLVIFYIIIVIFELILKKLIPAASENTVGSTGTGDVGIGNTRMGNIVKGFGKL